MILCSHAPTGRAGSRVWTFSASSSSAEIPEHGQTSRPFAAGASSATVFSRPGRGILTAARLACSSRSLPAVMRCLVAFLVVAPLARADGDPAAVSFEKDVLPVLKDRCFSCHDGRKAKAELRLDVRSRAVIGGESISPGLVPGKSAASEVFKRVVLKEDDEGAMPPTGDRLTAAQIAKLKAWIDAGAKWPDALANEPKGKHWAFIPPVRPAIPPGVAHPVDAFVRARLQGTGLKPSPEADKTTLLRRLSLDLIGLPPTPAEIDAFVSDPSPDAYRKQVDRLLASPHYGERWGRLWLDAARYADSDGYEKDKPRFVHFYRDWVINAFNRDLPYDRFIIEQLAGDLLPNPTQDQLVATGYLRNSMINEEGGIDPEQFRMEALFDRMDALGKGVLGLTVQCAQCHTHKYDPITQAEYYRLFAFLNNAHEACATVYTPEEQQTRASIFEKLKQIDDDLKHRHPDWKSRLAIWEKGLPKPATWHVVRPVLDRSGGEKHWVLADGSVLSGGYAPTKSTESYPGSTDLTTVTAARLECLTDPSLPRGGPGRSHFGLFALTEFKVELVVDGKATPVKLAAAYADAESKERPLEKDFDDRSGRKRVVGPVAFTIDGKGETAWSPDIGWGRSNVNRQAVFVFAKPVTVPKGAVLRFKLQLDHGGWNSDDNQTNNLGRFRFSVTADPRPSLDPAVSVRAILDTPADKRTPAQGDALFRIYRRTVSDWKSANEAADSEWERHPAGSSQLVLKERSELRATHLLKRGDFLKPAETVSVGVPAALHSLPTDAPASRLGLAKWLVDRRSPTTARAIVNRVWQAYFGVGLVSTPEDLGVMCEPPTHPELLDWLAVELMESGWSLKSLHARIVTSATYRQSSRVTPEGLAADPGNRLLARGPRFRVDAEVVRDIALKASGLLEERVGGPSVHPPIPKFLMLPPASYGPKVWPESQGADRYRRSLYVFSFRSVPYPPLAAFDAPPGEAACVKRPRSNTPIQALTALNEPVFVAAAQALGLRVLREGGDTDAVRLRHACRLTIGREPTVAERDILLSLLRKERGRFAAADSDPWTVAFAGPDEYKRLPHTATPADAAAWTAVARVLLNLDETLTKE